MDTPYINNRERNDMSKELTVIFKTGPGAKNEQEVICKEGYGV